MQLSEKVLEKLDFLKIKEQLSGYCILARAKEIAEQLVPRSEIREVRSMLRETDEAKVLLRLNPLFSVRGAKEIRPSLERCVRGGVLQPEELLELKDTIRVARQAKSTIMEDSSAKSDYAELFSLREIVLPITPQKTLEDEISRCISADGKISDKASEELGRIRRTIAGLQQRIKDTLDGIMRNPATQKMLQDRVITTRGDRYVVPVKQEYGSTFNGIVHDQSASGATLFIEPAAVVQLGNELKEANLREAREIQRILQQLTAVVAVKADEIAASFEALAALDFALAKALLSDKMNAGAPLILNKPQIILNKARHPLLSGKVVPLSIELGENFNILIITGPNTGGKTVTLKTVGLMSIMMQSGLHIPAESDSKMGVFSKIFIDIGDEQSVEQSLSTFSGHLKNIVGIMNEADDRSLVLFDEIGAGTDPAEGAALAMAIISELLSRGCRGIATTHYGTLKTFAYNTPGLENASVEFDSETLAPTYRLMIGIPGRSNAFSIAEKLGLNKSILDMAKTYVSDRQMKVSDLLENLEETQREVELNKLKAQEELQKAVTQNVQIAEKARQMYEKNEEILQKARDEAFEIVRRSKHEAEKVILEIKEAQKEDQKKQQAAIEKARHGIKKLSDGLYGGKGQTKSNLRPEQVLPGQMVYLPNLRQKGQVITKPDNSGEVIVQAGILKISVPISDIRIIDETRKTEHFEKTIKGSMGLNKAVTLRSEVDLRGTMVDEATEILDKYLDDAVLTGINQVSIIHGKGTGSLRNGVHQFLKRHPHVVNFRLGEYGEGDSGVTIVELK